MLKGNGFTLIELMVSTSILAILSMLVIPNYTSFLVRLRVDNEISTLFKILQVTRNSAINNGKRVTMCPLNHENSCSTDWQNAITVFIDINSNQTFDSTKETIIKIKSPIKIGDQLIYGKYRKSIVFHPSGKLSGLSNGTLRYCPQNNQDKSRAIIIARSGRIYTSTDIDNDGKDENRSNVEINCN